MSNINNGFKIYFTNVKGEQAKSKTYSPTIVDVVIDLFNQFRKGCTFLSRGVYSKIIRIGNIIKFE